MEVDCKICDGIGLVEVDDDYIGYKYKCSNCDGKGKFDVSVVDTHAQPMPSKNGLPFIKDLVMKDLIERAEIGRQRYGTYLQPHNGRDSLRDAYEESLDLPMYLRQKLYERDGK